MIRLTYLLMILLSVSAVYATEELEAPAPASAESAPIEVASIAPIISAERTAFSYANPLDKKTDSLSNQYISLSAKKFNKPDPSYKMLKFAFVGSIAADLISTWSLPKNMTEGNPLLGKSKAQQISVSAGMAFFTLLESHYLHKKGKRKTAKYLLWMGTIAHTFAASYNASH